MKNTKKKGMIKSIILAAASILGLASLGGKHKSNCSMCGMPEQHCIHKNKSA